MEGRLLDMSAPLSRALALLDLLQTRRAWPAEALCARLEITDRTLRRDLDRLRELGYRIASSRGTGGGYRLEAGTALPPLLLTDDEAVTVAIGLRSAATQGLAEGAQTALSALTKLEAMLPGPVRRRVSALGEHLAPLFPGDAPAVSGELLSELALACRDHERVRFAYTAADGARSKRVAAPHSVVASHRSWFLLAWDRDRLDWRIFRVDRMTGLVRTGARDPVRELPAEDAASYVSQSLSRAWGEPRPAELIVHLSLAEFRKHFGSYAAGASALDDDRTRWPLDGTSPGRLLMALAWLPADVDYELRAAPDVLAGLHRFAGQLSGATAGSAGAA